jgi:hypothetical protein
MTVAKAWSHKIDGVELNDFIDFATNVPEAESDPGATVLLTEMQGRTPVFNRQQPVEGKFTFLITVLWDSPADYEALLASLKVLFSIGAHTYTYQAPGQSSSQSVTVYFDGGLTTDPAGIGACTARAIAPDPTFA